MEVKVESFLLGLAFAALRGVQDYLIKSDHSSALSKVNEELLFLKDEINRLHHEKKDPAQTN